MAIWRTTPPKESDFPIWVISNPNSNDSNEVVLIRDSNGLEGLEDQLIWAHADVPSPLPDHIHARFQELCDSSVSDHWCSSDWFREGFKYAQSVSDSKCGCSCGQG